MKLLWLDVETTGLKPGKHQLLEVGWAITEGRSIVDCGNRVFYHCGAKKLDENDPETVAKWSVDPVVVEMHHHNGLWLESAYSSYHDHDRYLLDVLAKFDGKPVVAGRNVHFDLSWFSEVVRDRVSHRHFDTATLTMISDSRPKVKSIHRGLFDIFQEIVWLSDTMPGAFPQA